MKKYNLSLFIFRRDLRLADNTGLINALKNSHSVIPCFIFDPQQVGEHNKYKSDNAIQFMTESLKDLEAQLHKHNGKLYLFYGEPHDVITKIIAKISIDALFINRDYTPFSTKRDTDLKKLCAENSISFELSADALLNEPELVTKKDGLFYSKFTPFYKTASTIPVQKTASLPTERGWYGGKIDHAESSKIYTTILLKENENIAVHGGSKNGMAILQHLNTQKNYSHDHDYPEKNNSQLSAHLKYGTVSVRQTYYAIKEYLSGHHPLLRQLYWRDFFTHIAFHRPTVFGHAYQKKYDSIPWSNDKKDFKRWCNGTTGFPIVDAGMRELNATGFMHNRVRMIVASFLVKDLHINWLWGEKYFAQQLVDYDPAVNNGNWQWSASTGCDAQPYFRIFNPWLQQKKYDAECVYIKRWVPELREYDAKSIHNYFKENSPLIKGYPRPMVDHQRETILTKKMFASRML